MKNFLKDTIYRNAYYLIGAAWLFTLSFIFSNYWSYTSSPQGVKKSLEQYLHKHEKDFNDFLADSLLIGRLVKNDESESEVLAVTGKPYGIFIYSLEDYGPINLKYWSTQQTIPTDDMITRAEGEFLETMPNGKFEFIKRKINGPGNTNLLVCALIPIRWNFFIENDYLKNGFVDHPNIEKNYRIADNYNGIPIINSFGKTLFTLEKKLTEKGASSDWITILLRLVGMLLFFFYVHMVAQGLSRHFGAGYGIVFLVLVVFIVRLISYVLPFPINFQEFELFDPRIYGSNIILKTLGDLLINALLFVWLVLFARTQINKYDFTLSIDQNGIQLVVGALLSFLLVGLTLLCGNTIRSLVADSQISYDVTNFSSLTLYSVIGFIVLCCISLGFFISSLILLKFLDEVIGSRFSYKALYIAVIGLIIMTFRMNEPAVGFELGVLLWLLFYVFLFNSTDIRIARHIAGSSLVFWLVLFSASISIIIITQNRIREEKQRLAAAAKLGIQTDPSSEVLLSITVNSLSNDFILDNLPRFRNDYESQRLKDSIINANFQGYSNKFDTQLYLFDASGQPLSATDRLTFDTLNTIYSMQAKRTTIPDLKYYETDFTNFSYIYQKTVVDTSKQVIARLFMFSDPRKIYKNDASLYPELIKQTEEFAFERFPNYAFAVYDSLELIYNRNDYPFPSRLDPSQVPAEEYGFVNKDNYQELWYNIGGNRVVVITRKTNLILEAITLFSYIFCVFLFLVGLFQLANLIVRSGFQIGVQSDIWKMSIRNQIYSTIIFISIFSFFVIGVATIIFFIQRYNRNNKERLTRTIQVMSSDLNNKMGEFISQKSLLNLSDTATLKQLQQEITGISEIHNADINFYNINGELVVSSNSLVYNKGILSRQMDPVAFFEMKRMRKIQFVQNERYGRLNYLSIYVPVRDSKNQIKGYLNIPNFTSSRDLNQEISNFLIAIINLNAFIFLIAGVIAVFITNRITQSFSWIGEKMREINLGKHNEVITWGRNDEIGYLVKEYNIMVKKLEESVVGLAKTEREGAWREMARQVAHEIKNPLTPMKLSIQYLQKAIDNNAPNVKELSANVAKTLIEQIEHLSKIAAEFSQFANIGNTKNEEFDLHETLYSLVSLLGMNENVQISWSPLGEVLVIDADKTQINRLFTNLLQNAIEAIPDNTNGLIIIEEEIKGDQVLVSIRDNGAGIPEETQGKIFTPNFTTKTSGTGLGLAMCKGIVEKAKGEIWFETKVGEGTTFYVLLPLVKKAVAV